LEDDIVGGRKGVGSSIKFRRADERQNDEEMRGVVDTKKSRGLVGWVNQATMKQGNGVWMMIHVAVALLFVCSGACFAADYHLHTVHFSSEL
jgi:hypothetical protein